MDALFDPVPGALRDAEQFYPEAEIFRRLEVGERHAFDAFDMDRFGVDRRGERKRGQDRELMRGVEAADIEARIGFGVTETLRLLQTFVEGEFLALHPRQDVIARAVQNSVDALDRIAGKTLAQRLDDRDAAGDRCLEG